MRTQTIIESLYTYDELSEAAQARAREWYRSASAGDDFFAECVFNDAADIAELFGLDIRQTRKTNGKGEPVYVPTIYYSGFWLQGDGACFEGYYQYKPGALKAVKDYAPRDQELFRIVAGLQAVQKRYFYKLTASTRHRGHYYHSGCMSVDVQHTENPYQDLGDVEKEVTDLLRAFADWIYSQLEKEYDYQNSDEVVAETIRANEYEFDENGNIA